MAEPLTISPAPPPHKASDYEALRKAGIAYIERYAHALWTDYNQHDPGITTLEMLCYAITDLSHRTSLDMKDLLTSSFGSVKAMKESFLTAAQMLPSCPVTELDYRKLFIDVDGVRNAWLQVSPQTVHVNCKEPDEHQRTGYSLPAVPEANRTSFALGGLYTILLDYDPYYLSREVAASRAPDLAAARQKVLEQVRQTYLANRNLGEDCGAIAEVPAHRIMFCADLDLTSEARVSEVYAQVLFAVENYLSPSVRRYSLAQMQAFKNPDGNPLSTDQIFEGPKLTNGFILDHELQATALREVVYASDLINLIMSIKGVAAVKKVRLNDCEVTDPAGYRWCLPVRPGHQPRLCPDKVALAFYKDIIPVGSLSDKTKALERLAELQQQAYEENKKQVEDLPVPTGEVHDLATYRSVANDFPQNYGIGPQGLPGTASPERRAQARQLKAYLLFFDQLLSNYLAQLNELKSLFSAGASPAHTYFGQVVTDMVGVEELYADYAGLPDTLRHLLDRLEGQADNPARKNRFLDHLLARFAENFSEYALLMHTLYGERSSEEILEDKASFLHDYPRMCRGKAYDYCQPAWETDNVAGVTRRIARLGGIRSFQAHAASALTVMKIFPSEEGEAPQFKFRLHELKKSTRRKIYLTSTHLHDSEGKARRAMQRAFLPVPGKDRFQVRPVANGFTYVLKDEKGRTIARCPRTFKNKEEVWADVEEALESLLYGGEALFLVEHILLRPDPANPAENWLAVCTEPDCEHCEPLDPYTFRVSVVLPGYSTRLSDISFRRYLEKIIRLELPAHVLARICWVGREQLAAFEQKYKKWLTAKEAACTGKNNLTYAKALNELIAVLEDLHTIYPQGVLHNCENPDEENPLVLGRSTLGSL